MEPAVTTIYLETDAVAENTSESFYVDLSQVASLVNRRFYRQGINWVVGAIKIFSGVAGTVTCMKLPQTWMMRNAYVKGMAHWMKMSNEALEETESIRPRFMDFKIYADKDHHLKGFAANLLPKTFEVDNAAPPGLVKLTASPGEWEPSSIRFLITH